MYKSVLAVALLGASGMVMAQDARPTFEVSGSYFRPKADLNFRGTGTASDGTSVWQERDDIGFGTRTDGGYLEAQWLPADRHRVTGGWYKVGGDTGFGFSDAGSFEDEDGVTRTYDVDANARIDTDFEMYNLSYGYDFFRHNNVSVTGLIGVYGLELDSKARTGGTATIDGEVNDLDGYARYRERAHAPGVGIAAEWRGDGQYDKWDVRGKVQGFNASWGNFDLRGHFVHAQAQVGYKFTPTWSAFAAYDWFELNLRDDFAADATFEGIPYTANANVRGRLRVHGPAVGIRASF